jgi:hypothetical protein
LIELKTLRELAEQYEAEQPGGSAETAAPQTSSEPPAEAQITLLEGRGRVSAVWAGEAWAEYQAIYNAVESYHKRHRGITGGWTAWREAIKDMSQVYEGLGRHPLAFKLLNAVLAELERIAPPPPPDDKPPASEQCNACAE